MMFLFLLSLSTFNFCESSVCKVDEKKQLAIAKIIQYKKEKINSSDINLEAERRFFEQQGIDLNNGNVLTEEDEGDLDCCSFSMLMSFLCMVSFC